MTIKEAFDERGTGAVALLLTSRLVGPGNEEYSTTLFYIIGPHPTDSRQFVLLNNCTRKYETWIGSKELCKEKRKVWQWRYRAKDNKNWVLSSRLYRSEKDLKEANECYDPDNDCIYEKLPWTEMEE